MGFVISGAAITGSIELGIIYGIMALGVFLSFRTLNTADLTVDGSFVTGAAVSAMICASGGNPFFAIFAGFILGCLAGMLTALLTTKLAIQPLLSGILMMLALYSVNLRILGGKSNIPLMNFKSIFDTFESTSFGKYSEMAMAIIFLVFLILLLFLFLKTQMGVALRATGDNEYMVRAQGISSDSMKLLGMSLSNGLVGTSGAMIAQYQSYCDVGMGVGMVVIGLASVIIGEVIFGTKTLLRRLIAVALGSVTYRVIIAVALAAGMPSTDLKLVSAIIVAIALSAGLMGKKFKKFGKKFAMYKIGGGETDVEN